MNKIIDLADKVHINKKGFIESISGKCTVKELRQGYKDKPKKIQTMDDLGIKRLM